MAGRTIPRTAYPIDDAPLLQRVESVVSQNLKRTKYAKDERGNTLVGSDGEKVVLEKGITKDVPYEYYQLQKSINSRKALHTAIDSLLDRPWVTIEGTVEDFNHGLDYRAREELAQGVDPSLSQKQRDNIKRVQGLMSDGFATRDIAVVMLQAVGLTPEQVDHYLPVD